MRAVKCGLTAANLTASQVLGARAARSGQKSAGKKDGATFTALFWKVSCDSRESTGRFSNTVRKQHQEDQTDLKCFFCCVFHLQLDFQTQPVGVCAFTFSSSVVCVLPTMSGCRNWLMVLHWGCVYGSEPLSCGWIPAPPLHDKYAFVWWRTRIHVIKVMESFTTLISLFDNVNTFVILMFPYAVLYLGLFVNDTSLN